MSIFDLKTQTSELQLGNSGVSKSQYEMIAPSRDVSDTSFSNGPISFKFQHSSTKWWMPSKSYLRTRMSITKGDGTQLANADNIAPAMNLTSNLFQSMEFRIQDKVVSRCSDYVNAIDTLITRQNKSKAWIDSFGASTNFWEADQDKRKNLITSDGTGTKSDSFETVWTPGCLSIFNVDHALPGGANFELLLNPHNLATFQTACVESVAAKQAWSPAANGDFKVTIQSMYLYIHTVEAERLENVSYLLDLQSSRIQTDGALTSSFSQKMFDISPSTYAITVFYQDSRTSTSSIIPANKFTIATGKETSLNRFYLNYAGQSFPSPDYDLNYNTRFDYLTQLYTNTLINNGKYLSLEAVESQKDFLNRGMYITFLTPKDGSDRSTKVTINASFENVAAVNAALVNARLCVCDTYREVCRIVIKDGRCIDVQVEQA